MHGPSNKAMAILVHTTLENIALATNYVHMYVLYIYCALAKGGTWVIIIYSVGQ